jgi:hypothetical protein
LKFAFLFFVILLSVDAKAQETGFHVRFNSYASTGKALPFWFTSNQNGAFTSENGYYQLLRAGFARGLVADSTKKWKFTYGTTFIAGIGTQTVFQLNQYWIVGKYKWLVVKIGAKNDSVRFAGLSHTNANMIWSGNARPLQGITLSTNGYIHFFFCKKWLTVKALYEENFCWTNGI